MKVETLEAIDTHLRYLRGVLVSDIDTLKNAKGCNVIIDAGGNVLKAYGTSRHLS